MSMSILASPWFLWGVLSIQLYQSEVIIIMITKITIHFHSSLFLIALFFCQITIQKYQCPNSTCGNSSDNRNIIIDVIAESDDGRSVIHYLWSVFGSPTIIAAYFEKTDVELIVNWTEICSGSKEGISFSKESKYITAFVIPAIYEFQDPKDELFYTETDLKHITKHSFDISWESPEVDQKHNMTTFKASMLGGTVIFQVSRSSNFPSLI